MLNSLFATLAGYVWNYPVVGLCLLAGIFFTLRLGLIQFRAFGHALGLVTGKYDKDGQHGEISHFQALSAALSGTIGLGNIAGVAIAIGLGGPGSVLWMWGAGFLGMATKYVECALGTHYRKTNAHSGEVHGGPMYYIQHGLGEKWKPMAIFFGVCALIASFGIGNTFQSNQASAALASSFHLPVWAIGLALAVLVALVIIGGIRRIGKVASLLVPMMCIIYLFGAVAICLLNLDKIPQVFAVIFEDAFSGRAAAGGAVGTVIIWGIRRAIFSNEAGLGSAPIAHSAVRTDYPISEGIVALLEPFIDTLIVCSATALVIIISGNFGSHVYQPVNNAIISFETAEAPLATPEHWTVTNRNIPPETTPFLDNQHGDYALAFTGAGNTKGSLTLPSISLEGKNAPTMIRFYVYRESGNLAVDVLDSRQNVIKTVSLGEKRLKGEVIYAPVPDTWNPVLIPIDNAILTSPAEKTVTLRFRPEQETANWMIDRIEPVHKLEGIDLTTNAFDKFFHGFGLFFVSIAVVFFAFSTMITWSYYGEVAAYYVFGPKSVLPYKLVFIVMVFVGSIANLHLIVNFSDFMLGLMVVPNIIAITLLSPQVVKWTKDYFSQRPWEK